MPDIEEDVRQSEGGGGRQRPGWRRQLWLQMPMEGPAAGVEDEQGLGLQHLPLKGPRVMLLLIACLRVQVIPVGSLRRNIIVRRPSQNNTLLSLSRLNNSLEVNSQYSPSTSTTTRSASRQPVPPFATLPSGCADALSSSFLSLLERSKLHLLTGSRLPIPTANCDSLTPISAEPEASRRVPNAPLRLPIVLLTSTASRAD